ETFGSFIEKELLQIDIYGFLRNIKFRDTIFKSVSPSLPGCNITAINKILEDMNNA
ncbi:MAG TPA: ArsR family transcriptional regulator, partial [Pseudothermotoga sp.]|nr:ArsR family transcriptional regulator [Pseudothermotoga sp.]